MGFEFVALSLPPLIIGCLAAVLCALPGNFLILRRQALMGDAISHVVLPGIVVGFLVSGQTSTLVMLLGASAAALIAVLGIEAVQRLGRVEPGAAMGVVFTAMFAGGVVLLEMSDTSGVHLDVEHALYGNLESLIWLEAEGWRSLWDISALMALPPEMGRLALALCIVIVLGWVFWRALVISTFDPGFAGVSGIATWGINFGLVAASALAAVAAFDAVGSILVIAMFICPPAAARLLTSGLRDQVALSILFAILSAAIGYVVAGYGPIWLGLPASVSAAGMIAVASGIILVIASWISAAKPQRAG